VGTLVSTNSGYHNCPCRDCGEVAIGADVDGEPSLCHDCEEAGCSPNGDDACESEHSYARLGITRCPVCHVAVHASESDDQGRHPACATVQP